MLALALALVLMLMLMLALALVLVFALVLELVLVWAAKKHPRVQTEQVAMVPVTEAVAAMVLEAGIVTVWAVMVTTKAVTS